MNCPKCGAVLCENGFDTDGDGLHYLEYSFYTCPDCEKDYQEVVRYDLVFMDKIFEEV